MKRIVTAALALSLLGGTSALAQERTASGDPRHRRDEASDQARQQVAEHSRARTERKEAADARADAAKPQEQPAPARDPRPDRAKVEVQAHTVTRTETRAERAATPRAPAIARAVAEVQDRTRDDHRDAQRTDHRTQPAQHVIVGRTLPQRHQASVRDDHQQQQRSGASRRPGEGQRLRHRDEGRNWYDASRYQRTYRATHRFRVQHYQYPRGWYVRSWSFGDMLPMGWYDQTYYLDWWSYGLPRPPIGTEWVRMRDDAVLVDVWSGRVLSVYYNLFW